MHIRLIYVKNQHTETIDLFYVSIQTTPPFPDYIKHNSSQYELESIIDHDLGQEPHYTITYVYDEYTTHSKD